MAVQAAVSPQVQDFFQVQQAARTDVNAQDAPTPGGGANQEFKKLLLSMRQAKQESQGENSAGKNSRAPAVAQSAVPADDIAAFLEAANAKNGEPSPEKNAAAGEPEGPGRFDPDLILAPPLGGENAEDAENENIEGAEKGKEENGGEDNIPAGEIVAQDGAQQTALFAETPAVNAPASEEPPAETGASAAEALSGEYAPDGSDEKPAADIPNIGAEPAGKTADAVRADAGPAGGATAAENAEKPVAAPNGGPRKIRTDAENNAASQGEKTVSGRETSEAAGSPEKDSLYPPASYGAPAGRAAGEGAEVRFSAPAAYPLRSGNKFGEGLLSVVELMNRDGSPEARIVVEPPALGRIDVALRTTSNGVEALFRVENEELKQMVQFQLDSLKTSLQAQGIHVSALTVDIRNSEGQKDRSHGAPKRGRRAGPDGVEDDADEAVISRLDLENGLLYWVA
jgi:flagellar hook-length control protein FliK